MARRNLRLTEKDDRLISELPVSFHVKRTAINLSALTEKDTTCI
jgi:hypothetical protein